MCLHPGKSQSSLCFGGLGLVGWFCASFYEYVPFPS